MGYRFSQGFIDRVIAATDIAALIGRYTTLKRSGHKLVGLCPFHQEKTPSFTVDPERGLYYCCGCHAGGSIFTFLQEKEGMNFPEAVEHLARSAGIEMPAREGVGKPTDGLTKAAEFGARFFQKAIMDEIGREAREYLDSRGISSETWKKFGLGWAPKDRNHLLKSIRKAGKKAEPFIEIDLVAKSDYDRTLYSKIGDALVFPILRAGGKAVAFANRKIREDPEYDGPKYINSSDNDIYHKSGILYGLPQARSAIRKGDSSILVEGYFDVIALVEKGIENVVATCGTALTSQQASILVRYARKVVVLFDGDEAGLRATLRSLDILLGAGLEVFVVRLPDSEDPDSLVMKDGAEKLREIISSAPDWFDWLYEYSWGTSDSDGISAASSVADSMAIPLSAVADGLQRNLYVRELAKRLATSEEGLRDHLRKAFKKSRKTYSDTGSADKLASLPDRAKLEIALIAAIIHCGLGDNPPENILSLYPGLWEIAVDGATPAEAISEINDERARGYLSEMLFLLEQGEADTHRNMLIVKLSRINIKNRMLQLQENLRKSGPDESGGDISKTLDELKSLSEKLRKLGGKTPNK